MTIAPDTNEPDEVRTPTQSPIPNTQEETQQDPEQAVEQETEQDVEQNAELDLEDPLPEVDDDVVSKMIEALSSSTPLSLYDVADRVDLCGIVLREIFEFGYSCRRNLFVVNPIRGVFRKRLPQVPHPDHCPETPWMRSKIPITQMDEQIAGPAPGWTQPENRQTALHMCVHNDRYICIVRIDKENRTIQVYTFHMTFRSWRVSPLVVVSEEEGNPLDTAVQMYNLYMKGISWRMKSKPFHGISDRAGVISNNRLFIVFGFPTVSVWCLDLKMQAWILQNEPIECERPKVDSRPIVTPFGKGTNKFLINFLKECDWHFRENSNHHDDWYTENFMTEFDSESLTYRHISLQNCNRPKETKYTTFVWHEKLQKFFTLAGQWPEENRDRFYASDPATLMSDMKAVLYDPNTEQWGPVSDFRRYASMPTSIRQCFESRGELDCRHRFYDDGEYISCMNVHCYTERAKRKNGNGWFELQVNVSYFSYDAFQWLNAGGTKTYETIIKVEPRESVGELHEHKFFVLA